MEATVKNSHSNKIDICCYAIPGLIEKQDQNKMLVDRIIYAVCDYYKLTFDELKRRERYRAIVTGRQMIMYLLREKTNMSLKAIGEIFGKDHTTIIHAVRTFSGHLKYDDAVKRDYQSVIMFL